MIKLRCISLLYIAIALVCLTACTEKKSEMDQEIEVLAAKQGVTGKKHLEEVKRHIGPILATRERFSYKAIRAPCAEDIARLCKGEDSPSGRVQCLRELRDQVASRCEQALVREFGSLPLKEDKYYHGVLVPKGSTFFGNNGGDLLGAIVTEDIEYKGLRFKKGQIRFHKQGLSSGDLVDDQYVNGVKYKASRMSIFFHEDGTVENAVLAEDTKFDDILYKGGAQIEFYPSGQVQRGKVAKDVIVQGKTCNAGEVISFKKDGSIRAY